MSCSYALRHTPSLRSALTRAKLGRLSVLAREAVTVPAHRVCAHWSRCLAVSLRSSHIYLSIYRRSPGPLWGWAARWAARVSILDISIYRFFRCSVFFRTCHSGGGRPCHLREVRTSIMLPLRHVMSHHVTLQSGRLHWDRGSGGGGCHIEGVGRRSDLPLRATHVGPRFGRRR